MQDWLEEADNAASANGTEAYYDMLQCDGDRVAADDAAWWRYALEMRDEMGYGLADPKSYYNYYTRTMEPPF